MNVLVWIRRDLRVTDHPALVRAAALGRVLPLYVADPADWAGPAAAARQWEFVAETLVGLRADLADLGAPLVVRVGRAEEVIARLSRSYRIDRVLCLHRPGHPVPAGVEEVGPDAPLPPPALTPVPGVEPGLIPAARALGLAPDPCPHRQPGGRAAALALAESFAGGRGAEYPAALLSPVGGDRAGSRLSPHLAHGALSAAEVRALLPGKLPPRAARAFLDTLRLPPGQAPLPEGGDSRHLAAFAGAQTGLPLVDACLRQFRATGWLNARGRGVLASVAVHLLGLSVQDAGHVLGRLATDHDPAILWPQMAGLAGASARIANPVKLGQDHDPQGRFTRRWLPELAAVPDSHLHAPWRWEGAGRLLGRRYPEPVVDPTHAARDARDRLGPVRRAWAAPHRTQDLVLVEGTAASRPRPASAQLAFDL
ncbi:FAD-binding domain-containing protein [Gemmobacter sp.]|uniref:FAD-binding domain-containing protein n=1 Tax=Gemmobacter sp. TaxID=1898957 RepID=UPI002AFE29E1|nr:FAD-binding domain-containing protein [Gemmobacter sp.]